MAYTPHVLITFGGVLGSGTVVDSWQCGVRMAATDRAVLSSVGAKGQAYADALVTPLNTWFAAYSGTYGAFHQNAHLGFVKVTDIVPAVDAKGNDTGHYRAGVNPGVAACAANGPSGVTVPWFVTSAASWTTATARGLGHTGRVYLPWAFGVGINNTGQIPTNQVGDMLLKAKALLDTLKQTVAGVPALEPVVASKKAGSLNKITGVRMGNVLDVQRRRKEQIPEVYTAVAYP